MPGRTGIAVALVSLIISMNVQALESFDLAGASLTPSLDIGAAAFSHANQAFGARNSYYGFPVDKDGDRIESYVKYGLAVSKEMIPDKLSVDIKGSGVSTLTRGNSDGLGYTHGNPEHTDWEEHYIKFTGKDLFKFDGLSLSYGRQNFTVSDGFLIAEGHVDQGREGDYWLAPRTAFENAFILQADKGRFHADIFSLDAGADADVIDFKETVKIKGANIQWAVGSGHIGYMKFNVKDNALDSRDGMRVDDFRLINIAVPKLDNLSLSAEYTSEKNSQNDGNAWYVSGTYTFSSAPWTPSLTYRYSEFSEYYDSLLYGYGGDWGTWTQGEIVGSYMLFNINQKTSMVRATLHPLDTVSFGGAWYDFNFVERPVGVQSSDFAQEIDLFATWAASSKLTILGVAAIATPGSGAEQYFGQDKTSRLLEVAAIYSF